LLFYSQKNKPFSQNNQLELQQHYVEYNGLLVLVNMTIPHSWDFTNCGIWKEILGIKGEWTLGYSKGQCMTIASSLKKFKTVTR
jgi:hypothetical protein